MDRSLLSAVSGIDANQSWLDVIGSNIANANTTGFKQDNVSFGDLLSQQIQGATAPNAPSLGGVNTVSVGTGVKTMAITPDESQGTLQQTNNPTDVYINGEGYLIASGQGTPLYTRDGTLMFDANGNMVTTNGAYVQGWEASSGKIDTSVPYGNLTIPVGLAIPPQETANVTLGGNLPADAIAGTKETTTATIYDSQGNPLTLTNTFTAGAGNAIIALGQNDTITFNDSGGGGPYTATIGPSPAGGYSMATLATKVAAALNAAVPVGHNAYTVTNSGNDLVVTDTTAGGTFQITGGDALPTLGLNTMSSAVSSVSGTLNWWTMNETISNDAGYSYPTGTNTVTLIFNGSGNLAEIDDTTSGTGTRYTPNATGANAGVIQFPSGTNTADSAGGTLNPFTINFPARASGQNNVTQFAGSDSLNVLGQDGYATGTLASLSIGNTGIITGAFTNGQSLQLGQLAMATFANPQGLQAVGNNMWEGSANSGIALVGSAGSGGRGTLTGGALEASNVDMSTQLTNMVVAQTSYQANTRVVTTDATVLNSLIQMA